MAPFHPPVSILSGLKDKIEAFHVQGDRLYLGSATGTLYVYSFDLNEVEDAVPVETKKSLTRRAIEQIDFVKDINSLVILSDKAVSLYPLPNLSPVINLPQAKTAFSFGVSTTILYVSPDGTARDAKEEPEARMNGMATFVTNLLVGCQRKMVLYSWRDGEAQPTKEVTTPHSARTITFINHQTAVMSYTPLEHALFSIVPMTVTELTLPSMPTSVIVPGIGSMGMGGLSGLGGYMTLGLGQKNKPVTVTISESEVLIRQDQHGFFVGVDGTLTRTTPISWPTTPDEIAFVRPYIFYILPPGSGSDTTVDQTTPISSSVQIRSSFSLSPVQTLIFPLMLPNATSSTSHYGLRLLTASASAKGPLFLLSAPMERAAATSQGSTLWRVNMRPWGQQIDELVEEGSYVDALALLNFLDISLLPNKESRKCLIRTLQAVSDFQSRKYDTAIDTFIELDINPAKVVALYPESISGRLSVPREEWLTLFGGPIKPKQEPTQGTSPTEEDARYQTPPGSTSASPSRATPVAGTIRSRFKNFTLDAIVSSTVKDDDTASITSKRREKAPVDDFRISIDILVLYLTDRRPQIGGVLAALHITPSQSHQYPLLSALSVQEIFSMQNQPLSALTPQQLVRYAQIVDTALFKAYLLIQPSMLSPLCRVDNWCEVEEVEGVLLEKGKYTELKDLYHGKKMHSKALELLRRRSVGVTELEEKLGPSIYYLQRLGPSYADVVFKESRWIFDEDADAALRIFTSEETELPRKAVADYLEGIDSHICAKFIEFLIAERSEESTMFHDRLAQLYLSMTLSARKTRQSEEAKSTYTQYLNFISSSLRYRTAPLFALMPAKDMYEARAILLGRDGQHQQALETYVYRLQDYLKAEEYCKSVYDIHTQTKTIFLTLLRIYLRPTGELSSSTNLLQPALDLISRHSPRLDTVLTLELLPPLVTAKEAKSFLCEALRVPRFDASVMKEVARARSETASRKLMVLEGNRVKITDSRICPQCHKRLGNSVIAVHMPRGEVTHYQCREAFSRKLKEST